MHAQTKKQLEELAGEMENRIERLSSSLSSKHSQDFAEQATERENEEVMQRLLEEANIELKQVRLALRRIEDGSYGECLHCSEDIAPARLEAMPYSSYCVRCADLKH